MAEEEINLAEAAKLADNDPLNTGFKTYISTEESTEKWVISGRDMQVLTTTLAPGEEIHCDPGSMMFMHPGIEQGVDCGMDTCFTRCCAGESCCKVRRITTVMILFYFEKTDMCLLNKKIESQNEIQLILRIQMK